LLYPEYWAGMKPASGGIMKILFFALAAFLFSSPAFSFTALAKDINVLRNFSLAPVGDGYGMALFLEEANPDVVSDNVLENGCSFVVRSKGNYLLSARYRVGFEEETQPGSTDGRWWKQYTNWGPGSDMRVSCKSDSRIDEDYVRKVMGGYVRIER
jgi:hypothetical protein